MKKIVYIFEGSLKHCNSVRDIFYNMLCQFDPAAYEQVIVSYHGMLSRPMNVQNIDGYKTYSARECPLKTLLADKELSLLQKISFSAKSRIAKIAAKIPRIRHIYRNKQYNRFYNKVFQLENPDIVVYFAISPEQGFSKICKRRNIPYVSILYDTYISRPHITAREAAIEYDEIANSAGYFVPNFFIDDYKQHYDLPNIHSFRLPLLIPKDEVLAAYKNAETKTAFAYFGQLQAFRNVEQIKTIFKELGVQLNIFSTENRQSDDTYVFNKPVQGAQLYETVASGDFLVAFDNGAPYEHYLPSKAYLYVSFTKPIIVFGNNKESAIKRFLSGYPAYYYHNIDDPSLDGLRDFINAHQGTTGFDKKIYAHYTDYLPQTALSDIVALIQNTINKTPKAE